MAEIGKTVVLSGLALMGYIFLRKGNKFFVSPPIEQQLGIRNGQIVADVVERDRLRVGAKVLTIGELMDLVLREKVRVVSIFRFDDEEEKSILIEEAKEKLRSVGAIVRTQVFFRAIGSLPLERIDDLLELLVFNQEDTADNLNIFVRSSNNVFVPIEQDTGQVQEMLVDEFVLRRIVTLVAPVSITLNVDQNADRNFAKEVEQIILEDKPQSTLIRVRDI
ncbi:hypothetical protein [Candidatus Uabimicrobium amorphum]|uniref:Uncharacterized protein n=1 Tax=Uabimicrobium amorphum TaxID=2596890 RepID=A0A5S9IMU3_UABAM|nr:hypothetical protein [Candidatus Uabimicrobium amorphum]BBM84430.1 hypothetical protein UABAM_02790 [Candidatus Uabimicrobium amorphum]